MNRMNGITDLKVKFFIVPAVDPNAAELNRFLQEHNGDIVDIQYQQNDFTAHQVMVVYR